MRGADQSVEKAYSLRWCGVRRLPDLNNPSSLIYHPAGNDSQLYRRADSALVVAAGYLSAVNLPVPGPLPCVLDIGQRKNQPCRSAGTQDRWRHTPRMRHSDRDRD